MGTDGRDGEQPWRLAFVGPGGAATSEAAGSPAGGPDPFPPPGAPGEPYAGSIPVFQWQIDPSDPSLESGEARVVEGEREYEVRWRRHPDGLVYVSVQATVDDPAIVGLVWDESRHGIVAIHGAARDLRPFVGAFRKGLGMQEDRANGW